MRLVKGQVAKVLTALVRLSGAIYSLLHLVSTKSYEHGFMHLAMQSKFGRLASF